MLGIAAALLPHRPRTAIWIMTREPAFSELRDAVRTVRAALWPQIGWVAAGAFGAAALARIRAVTAAPDAPSPVEAEPVRDETREAVPFAASAAA